MHSRFGGTFRLPVVASATVVLTLAGYLGASAARAANEATVGVPAMPQAGDAVSVLRSVNSDSILPTAAGLQAALAPMIGAPALGPTVQVSVYDPFSGTELFSHGGDAPAIPASTNKILSAAAAMSAYGADHRIATRVVRGTAPGEIVLVGGGDPLLRADPSTFFPGSATLKDLATKTADVIKAEQAKLGPTPIHLKFDDSLFSPPTTAPSWAPNYVSEGLVSRITALLVNNGFVGGVSEDPSVAGAKDFAAKLRGLGVNVVGLPTRATATSNAPEIASVLGAPLSAAAAYSLEHSDNTMAEMLAHLAGVKLGGSGSFTGGANAVLQMLKDQDIPTQGVSLFDGSGLSRENRVPPSVLSRLLSRIAQNDGDGFWAVSSGFPVAGFNGTLHDRFGTAATRLGRGDVRAKTGTLTGVSALSGFAYDNDGSLLAFTFMASATPDLIGAEVAWDKAAAALAQCGC